MPGRVEADGLWAVGSERGYPGLERCSERIIAAWAGTRTATWSGGVPPSLQGWGAVPRIELPGALFGEYNRLI